MSPPLDREPTLGARVRRGVAVVGVARFVRQALDFATSIVLARLLLPESFGVVALAAVFVQLSWVVASLGVGTAVIQARELSDGARHAGYWLSASFGAALTVLFAALSPALARWFETPALTSALPVLSLQFVLAGMSAVPAALLRRALSFGRLVAAETVGSVALAVASIGLALRGFELESLLAGPLAGSAASLVALHVLARYWPRLAFERAAARRLFSFGAAVAVKNLLVFLGRNLDTLIVARALGPLATGFYSRAYNYASTFELRVLPAFYEAVFSAYCRVRDDRALFFDWYTKTSVVAAAVLAPMALGLLAVAPELTRVALGEKWLPAVPLLRVLCVSSLFLVLQRFSVAALEAYGALRYELFTQSLYCGLMLVLPLCALRRGALGVAWAVVAASLLHYLGKAWALRRAIGLPYAAYFGAHVPAVAAGGVMAAAVTAFLASPFAPAPGADWQRLLLGVALGVVVYPVVLLLVRPSQVRLVREQLALLVSGSAQRAPEAT